MSTYAVMSDGMAYQRSPWGELLRADGTWISPTKLRVGTKIRVAVPVLGGWQTKVIRVVRIIKGK